MTDLEIEITTCQVSSSRQGYYLRVGRKAADSRKISHLIWNDPVAQVEPQGQAND